MPDTDSDRRPEKGAEARAIRTTRSMGVKVAADDARP
jgi:hypothetical protein